MSTSIGTINDTWCLHCCQALVQSGSSGTSMVDKHWCNRRAILRLCSKRTSPGNPDCEVYAAIAQAYAVRSILIKTRINRASLCNKRQHQETPIVKSMLQSGQPKSAQQSLQPGEHKTTPGNPDCEVCAPMAQAYAAQDPRTSATQLSRVARNFLRWHVNLMSLGLFFDPRTLIFTKVTI